MNSKKLLLFLSTTLILFLIPQGVMGAKPNGVTKTIKIDCSLGESINEALENSAAELIIEVDGMCTEDVVVRRDRVTIIGNNPDLDGIIALSQDVPEEPTTDDRIWLATAVQVRDARYVKLENLTLTSGGWSGLRIINSRRGIQAINCRFEGNRTGAIVEDSALEAVGTTFNNNTTGGVAVTSGGRLDCSGCMIEGQPVGLTVTQASMARLTVNSEIDIDIANQHWALWLSDSSVAILEGGTLSGDISVQRNSHLEAEDATLNGQTLIEGFSNGGLWGATGGGGLSILCTTGGDLFCDNSSSILSSNCNLCPAAPLEVCDGRDNDGDWQIDEELVGELCPLQEGVCAGSSSVCLGSAGWTECDYQKYPPEHFEESESTCDDGLDNDCDGEVDECASPA